MLKRLIKYLGDLWVLVFTLLIILWSINVSSRNMQENNTFACAINCMDGRVQDAVKNYMTAKYGVKYVDMITEAGPDKILADNSNTSVIEDIKDRIKVSVRLHGAKVIAIVGHHECAGNPVDKEEHIKHLKKAKEVLAQHFKDVEIILLWVEPDFKTVELIE